MCARDCVGDGPMQRLVSTHRLAAPPVSAEALSAGERGKRLGKGEEGGMADVGRGRR